MTDDHNTAQASAAKPEAKPVNCNICNKSFPHKGSLRRHRQSKHPVKKAEADAPEPEQDGQAASTFDCALCNQAFTRQSSLRQHQRSKHRTVKTDAPAKEEDKAPDVVEAKTISCDVCDKLFTSRNSLRRHLKSKHASDKKCKRPAKSSTQDENAEQEPTEETATQESKASDTHQCTLCDKSFRFKSALVQHGLITHAMADHTVAESSGQVVNAAVPTADKKAGDVDEDDEKPYCQTCQKTFRHAKGLADHKRNKHGIVETETTSKQGVPENPTFRCRPCDKTFRLSSSLRQHQRDSHPEMHRREFSEDEIMRQLLRMAVPPFGDDDGDDVDDDDDLDEFGYEDDSDVPFLYAGPFGFTGHEHELPTDIEADDTYDSDPNAPCWQLSDDSDEDDFDDDWEASFREHRRSPPILCTHCNKCFPVLAFEGHQWHAHGISSPAIIDVQAKIAKDDSYGPKRTVCKSYPKAKDFPFFFEAKYFLRDCHYKNCGQSFETGTERIAHEVEAHNRCITCELYFKTESALEEHQSNSKVIDTVVRDFDHWLEFAVGTRAQEDDEKEKAARRQARDSNPDKKIDCIACDKKFEKASTMMKHVETGRCIPGITEMDIFVLGQRLSEQGAPCVKRGRGFTCPVCDISFMVLSKLIKHAEGDECSLNVLHGPLQELISLLMMDFMSMAMGHEW